MRGSVLIITLFIMAAMSMVLVSILSIASNHLLIAKSEELHQEAYYLAETGMIFAQKELQTIVMRAYEECMAEFKWDPIKYPLSSMQECVQRYINSQLGPKINKHLTDKGYILNFPNPKLPDMPTNAKIDVRVRFTNLYQDPSRFLISARGEIGKIKRRIDGEVLINKISGFYSSKLFEQALLTGGNMLISNGGRFIALGPVFVQGAIKVEDNSVLTSNAKIAVRGDIQLLNGSSAMLYKDVVSKGVIVKGEYGSHVSCLSDVYIYGEIAAFGIGNTIELKSSLFACPDDASASVGMFACDGARITLEGDGYINGTLNYPASSPFLFGLENVSVGSNVLKSCESIGGANALFYFPDFSPKYAATYIKSNFSEISPAAQADLVYRYMTNPPESKDYLDDYTRHLECIDNSSIQITKRDESGLVSGYTAGLLFADNQVDKPIGGNQPTKLFEEILLKMKMQTSWDYRYHLNTAIQVPTHNLVPEEGSFSLLDLEKPIIYILPGEKDIILPSGAYQGILITNGSIHVPVDSEVEFTGLLIAGKDLVVEGSLSLHQDEELLTALLGQEGEALQGFFKVEAEKEIFEIRSCKEVLYNLQW